MDRSLALLAASIVLAGCRTTGFPPETSKDAALVPANETVEVGIDDGGRVRVVEFHVPPDALPAAIRAAADREMPGGEIVGCEKEYVDGVLHWEVTKRVSGKEVEVLFDMKGNPVEWEIEIDRTAAPAAVLAAADSAAGGSVTKIEEIRDGAKKLTAYHVKKADRGIRYKLEIAPDGRVLRVLRETNAEIEIPIR
jgi:hypothetical protein